MSTLPTLVQAPTLISIVGGVGQLALAAFAWSHGLRARFPFVLGILCADFAGWTLAAAAYQETGDIRWHILDFTLSPYVPPLGLALVAAFVGAWERHRRALRLLFVPYAALSLVSASAWVSSDVREWIAGPGWPSIYLTLFVPTVLASVVLLVRHRREAGGAGPEVLEERRTNGVLVALVVAALLALTEFFADLGVEVLGFDVPRLGNLASLSTAFVLIWLGVRERLFDLPRGPRALALGVAASCLLLMIQLMIFTWAPLGTALALAFSTTLLLFGALLGLAYRGEARARVRKQEQLLFAGRMATQLAHDLRNPLMGLRGALDVVRESVRRGESADDAMLTLAADQERRISDTLDAYLQLSRLEPSPALHELSAIAREAAAPFDDAVSLQADAARVSVDGGLLIPALQNLIKNALESKSATPVRLALTMEHGFLRAEVSDQGEGMDPRRRESAMEGFFTTKADGSGMGLMFARRVAEAHGGDIRVHSQEGAGTRVVIRIPTEETYSL